MMNEREKNGTMEEVESLVKGIEYKIIGEILIITAIVMYIISVFSFMILPFSESLNIFIFGLIIAAATALIIYGGFQLNFYHKLNNDTISNSKVVEHEKIDKQKKDSITSIFSMLATISYLYMGFFHGMWHPGWLVFLLIPIVNALYDLFKTRQQY